MKKTLYLISSLILLFSCSKDNGDPVVEYVSIEQLTVDNISEHGVTLTAVVAESGNAVISEKGFCLSATNAHPAKEDLSYEVTGSNFTVNITDLQHSMAYYACAYAVTSRGLSYSKVVRFTTLVDEERELNDALQNFIPPSYADDYSNIASWAQRSRWNLANVHDPTVAKCGEYFYMYQTDASYGNALVGHGHFPYRRSKDLVTWEYMGSAMNDAPAWVTDSLNNMRARQGLAPIANPVYGFWAPAVAKISENKYRLYYSIPVENFIGNGLPSANNANFDNTWTERAFIGMMETSDLQSNQWTDKGMVVVSSTDRGNNWTRQALNNWNAYFKWNAIDPDYIIDSNGNHWLIYGSWHSGIAALQLNEETGLPLHDLGNSWDINALDNYGTRIYTRNAQSRWQASEGAEMIYNSETGYYYLFLAYDELSVAYNTRVARSHTPNGNFVGFSGSSVSGGGEVYPIITHPYKFNDHSGWVGISHCTVFQDDNGDWFYCSQARLPENTGGNSYSNAIMMGHVRKIRFTEDGWPVVMPERYSAVPDVRITDDELIGSWEMIRLRYQYQAQQTSQTLTLNGDKTATGALSGNWSWNADTKTLTVGAQKLYLERETDWEANPRKHTIVFAGLNANGESLWGKKK